MGSPAFVMREDMDKLLSKTWEGIRFEFRYGNEKGSELEIPYIAEYQMMNASLAYFSMQKLQPEHNILKRQLIEGIRKTKWPVRIEIVMDGVIIDGAHNEDGVEQFVKTAVYFGKDTRISILFSAVSDKRYQDMIREISDGIHPDLVVTTEISGNRKVSAEELKALFCLGGCREVYAEPQVEKAFEKAYAEKADGLMFCVGSLYLAGEVKDWIARRAKDAKMLN